MTRVEISRLDIRFKDISRDTVRLCGNGLGEALLERLARRADLGNRSRSYSTGTVDAGTVRTRSGSTPGELRRTIADRLSGIIVSKIEGRTG